MKTVKDWAFPDSDQLMSKEMTDKGEYQKSHLDAALKHVRNFRVAIDGGAHVGCWSKALSEQFAHVYAFEPALDTHACLVANMYKFNRPNITCVNAALGDWHGRVRVGIDGDAKAERLGNTGARAIREGDECPIMTIDDLHLTELDFLKLDVEGYEPAALRGARKTLLLCRPIVLFEDKGFCARYGGRKGDSEKLLTELGAQFIERVGADQIWGWKCESSSAQAGQRSGVRGSSVASS